MVEMINVESSNIESIGWENNTLFVNYLSGSHYKYKNVPREVFLALLGSKSRGRFMNTEIKGKYDYEVLIKTK